MVSGRRTIAFTPASEDPGDHYGLDADRDLYTVAADGTGLRRVVRHAYDAVWSPDGRIVFDRNDQIRIVDADGSNDEQFVA